MSTNLIHQCSACNNGKEIDCTTCKLASLSKKPKSKKDENDVEEDDYSISEQLTTKDNNPSILFLFIAAVAVFGLVVLFTLIMK